MLWTIISCLVAFVLGVWFGPKVKEWALHLRSDPIGEIKADIARLQALKERFLGRPRPPPNTGGTP